VSRERDRDDEPVSGLFAARPIVPDDFADAVLRRATAARPVPVPEARGRTGAIVAAALTVLAAAIVVLLVRPRTDEPPVIHAAPATTGPLVTLVEYMEYECPFCALRAPELRALAARYPRELKIVYKNYPMDGHRHARLAAEAALAAGEQGKYLEMHDLLFADPQHLELPALERRARELGLDMARFDKALAEHRFAAQIDRDIEEAQLAGLTGVPIYIIDGEVFVGGVRPSEIEERIQQKSLIP